MFTPIDHKPFLHRILRDSLTYTSYRHPHRPLGAVERKGIALTVDALLDQLAGIQEVVNLYPASGDRGGRPRARRVRTAMNRLQEQLHRHLDLGRFHGG